MDISKAGFAFSDERGDIVDILVNEMVEYVTLITSKKGAVRGNHYHKDTFQWVYMLSGVIRVYSQIGDNPAETHEISPGELILNAPLEKHAFEALEDASFLVFTRGPRGGENYEDDTYRLETPLAHPSG